MATENSFGWAIKEMVHGAAIRRRGWNGIGMFVYYVPAAEYPAQTGAAKAHFGANGLVPYNAYMAIKGTDGRVSTWAPSVGDCLALDWEVA